jgi:hypothetical protein
MANPIVKTPAQLMMEVQMGSLTPQSFANLNSITNKYPGISNDVAIAMVRQGLNADTPGLNKIATLDGLAALKNEKFKVDKLKSSVKPDRGILGSMEKTFREAVYNPFKGTLRTTFAGLRLPYDIATVSVRNLTGGEDAIRDMGNAFSATTFGSLLESGGKGTGSGFFISPETKVGKAQAKAMGKYNQINGESFTIGRSIFNGLNMNPNSNAYRISSGIVDAVLNVGLDPTMYFGPGAVTKLISTGSKETKIFKGIQADKEALGVYTAKEIKEANKLKISELEKENLITVDKINKKISSQYTRFAPEYKKLEKEIIANETVITNAQMGTFKKLLNTNKDIYAWEGVDKAAEETLSSAAIAKWFIQNPKVQTGELTKAISLLAADMKNTGGFFDGLILMDEVPQMGQISMGVHAAGNIADEFAVTLKTGKELKLLDIADTFVNATQKTRTAESLTRSKYADAIDKMAKGRPEAEFRVLTELSTELRTDMANLDGFLGSIFVTGDELTAATPLVTLLQRIAEYKNPALSSELIDLAAKTWKVDGFSNIRSIYGQTGGVVVTNTKRLAAKGAEFGNAAAEVLDPTNLGPNLMKVLESIKAPKDEIARLENEVNTLNNKILDLKDKENYFNLLREKAHGDPEILKELIQDPGNAGIKGLLNLELKITENNVLKEALLKDVGITDNFQGEILGTHNSQEALKFVLGRQFKPILELISKETDTVSIKRLFNRKLDDTMVKELAVATTSDEVAAVFIKQFSPENSPQKIRQALSAGVKIATNPVARMVPAVNLDAIRYAENINKVFGRFYIRTTALNLNDLTGLNNGVEDWMSSIGLTKLVRNGTINKDAHEAIIANTQRAIFKATTPAERAKAVSSGIDSLMDEVGKSLKLKPEDILELKKKTKIYGEQEAVIKSYTLENSTNNGGAKILNAGGVPVELDAMREGQLVRDVINLPDSRAISNTVASYRTNVPLYGLARSSKIFLEETNDLWRTAQLVLRVSYMVRNVAEMQLRQFFSGHNSLFNNPVGFIAMMIANPEGTTVQKAFAKRAKYTVNALGQNMKATPDEEVEFSRSLIARMGLMRGTSVGDYGSAGRAANIKKAYYTVGTDNPDFLKGLAWTINNYSADKFMPDVITVMRKGTEEAKTQYIDNLIDTFDEPGNKLREFASAIYDKNVGMRNLLFKNPGLETGPGVVKENMSAENIRIWLFDQTQDATYAGQLRLLGGNGSQKDLIMDLILNGQSLATSASGKAVRIRTPYRQQGLTTEQVLAAEKAYTKQIESVFQPEQLTDSLVTKVDEISMGAEYTKVGTKITNTFFQIGGRVENRFNFCPEFDAAYWDYIAGYADMLSTPELKTLLKNANTAFAPIRSANGKMIGRLPGGLRKINTTLKDRLKDPNYVHEGGATIATLDGIAADQASKYVENLFYDAAKQKQWANAARLVAPFAQAHYNTMGKWAELMKSNPVPAYKFSKAFDALTKEGSNVIYDRTGMTYDDNQGFIYKDENTNQYKFKMPLVGNFLGALAGGSISAKDAVQITSPVESLNLAFGSVNPVVPGFGPAMVAAYQLSGRSSAFGPIDDVIRDILTPFGEPKTPTDLLFPSWLKKTFAAFQGNDATTLRNVKDFAAYLASTGEYGGDQALVNDAERTRLFNDATKMARSFGLVNAFFTSISPSVPMTEVLASIKNPENKQNFMTMSMLYDHLQKLKDRYPSDQGVAISKFAETFGANNLLVAVSGTTPGTSAKEDAWTFLNNNPGASDKYGRPNEDVVPFFFPGGEYSQKYYNWQVKSGARRKLSTAEIMQESENMVYAMLKSQITERQIAGFYTGDWYVEEIAKLNKQFGGAKPVDTLVTGISDARVATVEKAIQDPAIQSSPVYKQISEFYPLFSKYKDLLNQVKVSNYAELSSKGGLPTLMRNELVTLGEKLMTENPDFIPMYYGVFHGILKESK